MGFQRKLFRFTILALCGLASAQCGSGIDTDRFFQMREEHPFLDITLDGTGFVSFTGANDSDAKAVAIAPDGTTYVAGTHHNGSDDDIAVWKVLPDGRFDPGFGTGGMWTYPDEGGPDSANAILIYDDEVIVVGHAWTSASGSFTDDVFMARLTTAGTPSTAWSVNPQVSAGIDHEKAAGATILPGSPDTLQIVGECSGTGCGPSTLFGMRLNPATGATIAGFAVTSAVPGDPHTPKFAIPAPDGEVVIAGTQLTGGIQDDAFFTRLCPDLTSTDYDWTPGPCEPDGLAFTAAGTVNHDGAAGVPGSADEAFGVTLFPTFSSPNMLFTGYSTADTDGDTFQDRKQMSLWMYGYNGALDTSWDSNGLGFQVYPSTPNMDSVGHAVFLTPGGRILVVGYWGGTGPSADWDMAVWGLFHDGTPDPNFPGVDGLYTHSPYGLGKDVAHAGFYDQVSRKLTVVGTSYAGPSEGDNMTVWRFNID